MARGRAQAAGLALSPALSFDQIKEATGRDLSTRLLREAEELLARYPRDSRLLVEAARHYMLAGERRQALSTLEQALAADRAETLGARASMAAARARQLQEIIADPEAKLLDQGQAERIRGRAGYPQLLNAATSRALRDLVALDRREAALGLCEEYWSDRMGVPASPSADQWERARIIARAETLLAAPVRDWATNGMAVSAADLARERARLAGGDRAERAAGKVGGARLSEYRHHPASSCAEIFARAHAMARNPERFALERMAWQPIAIAGESLRGAISATPTALRELCVQHPSAIALMEGGCQAVLYFWRDDDDDRTCQSDLVVRLKPVRAHDNNLAIEVFVSLGRDEADDRDRLSRERARQIGLGRLVDGAPSVELVSNAVQRTNLGIGYEGPGVSSPATPPSRVFGDERCAHRRASWIHTDGGVPGASALCLSCPDCLRERVALIPAHRVPAPSRPTLDEAAYLAAERYRRALLGQDPGAVPARLDELIAREDSEDLSPERWASGAQATRRRGADLAVALAARRR